MATPNYNYEKRQRELAKKKKKEEKLRERDARKASPDGEFGQNPDMDAEPDHSQIQTENPDGEVPVATSSL
jgi:hypothetical protein